MPFARKVGSSWEELTDEFTVRIDGADYRFPAGSADSLTQAERISYGIFPIADAGPEPTDVNVLGKALGEVSGKPAYVWTTVPFTSETLGALKTKLVAQVNREAGAFRSRFITAIPGQETTYILKEAEAKAWSADADQAAFPYLTEEAARTGMSLPDLVALVLTTAAQWRAIDPKVEGLRRGATVAIDAAETATAAQAAAVVDWNAALAA